MDVLWIVLSGVAGLAIGSGCMVGLSKAGLNKNQQKAEQILKEAQNEAESRVKQAVLDGKTQAHDLRVEAEKEIKERKQESMELENKLLRREDNLNFRDEALNQKERQINEKMNYLRLWKRKWNMKQLRISKIKRMRQRLLPMKKHRISLP